MPDAHPHAVTKCSTHSTLFSIAREALARLRHSPSSTAEKEFVVHHTSNSNSNTRVTSDGENANSVVANALSASYPFPSSNLRHDEIQSLYRHMEESLELHMYPTVVVSCAHGCIVGEGKSDAPCLDKGEGDYVSPEVSRNDTDAHEKTEKEKCAKMLGYRVYSSSPLLRTLIILAESMSATDKVALHAAPAVAASLSSSSCTTTTTQSYAPAPLTLASASTYSSSLEMQCRAVWSFPEVLARAVLMCEDNFCSRGSECDGNVCASLSALFWNSSCTSGHGDMTNYSGTARRLTGKPSSVSRVGLGEMNRRSSSSRSNHSDGVQSTSMSSSLLLTRSRDRFRFDSELYLERVSDALWSLVFAAVYDSNDCTLHCCVGRDEVIRDSDVVLRGRDVERLAIMFVRCGVQRGMGEFLLRRLPFALSDYVRRCQMERSTGVDESTSTAMRSGQFVARRMTAVLHGVFAATLRPARSRYAWSRPAPRQQCRQASGTSSGEDTFDGHGKDDNSHDCSNNEEVNNSDDPTEVGAAYDNHVLDSTTHSNHDTDKTKVRDEAEANDETVELVSKRVRMGEDWNRWMYTLLHLITQRHAAQAHLLHMLVKLLSRQPSAKPCRCYRGFCGTSSSSSAFNDCSGDGHDAELLSRAVWDTLCGEFILDRALPRDMQRCIWVRLLPPLTQHRAECAAQQKLVALLRQLLRAWGSEKRAQSGSVDLVGVSWMHAVMYAMLFMHDNHMVGRTDNTDCRTDCGSIAIYNMYTWSSTKNSSNNNCSNISASTDDRCRAVDAVEQSVNERPRFPAVLLGDLLSGVSARLGVVREGVEHMRRASVTVASAFAVLFVDSADAVGELLHAGTFATALHAWLEGEEADDDAEADRVYIERVDDDQDGPDSERMTTRQRIVWTARPIRRELRGRARLMQHDRRHFHSSWSSGSSQVMRHRRCSDSSGDTKRASSVSSGHSALLQRRAALFVACVSFPLHPDSPASLFTRSSRMHGRPSTHPTTRCSNAVAQRAERTSANTADAYAHASREDAATRRSSDIRPIGLVSLPDECQGVASITHTTGRAIGAVRSVPHTLRACYNALLGIGRGPNAQQHEVQEDVEYGLRGLVLCLRARVRAMWAATTSLTTSSSSSAPLLGSLSVFASTLSTSTVQTPPRADTGEELAPMLSSLLPVLIGVEIHAPADVKAALLQFRYESLVYVMVLCPAVALQLLGQTVLYSSRYGVYQRTAVVEAMAAAATMLSEVPVTSSGNASRGNNRHGLCRRGSTAHGDANDDDIFSTTHDHGDIGTGSIKDATADVYPPIRSNSNNNQSSVMHRRAIIVSEGRSGLTRRWGYALRARQSHSSQRVVTNRLADCAAAFFGALLGHAEQGDYFRFFQCDDAYTPAAILRTLCTVFQCIAAVRHVAPALCAQHMEFCLVVATQHPHPAVARLGWVVMGEVMRCWCGAHAAVRMHAKDIIDTEEEAEESTAHARSDSTVDQDDDADSSDKTVEKNNNLASPTDDSNGKSRTRGRVSHCKSQTALSSSLLSFRQREVFGAVPTSLHLTEEWLNMLDRLQVVVTRLVESGDGERAEVALWVVCGLREVVDTVQTREWVEGQYASPRPLLF